MSYLTGTTLHFTTDWEQILPTIRASWRLKTITIFPLPFFGVIIFFHRSVDTVPQAVGDMFVAAVLTLMCLSSRRIRNLHNDPKSDLYDPEFNWWKDIVCATYYSRKLSRVAQSLGKSLKESFIHYAYPK